MLKGFDIVASSGGTKKAHVAEFKDIHVTGNLVIEMIPAQAGAAADHQPLLNGVEILRTNAKEIKEQVAGRGEKGLAQAADYRCPRRETPPSRPCCVCSRCGTINAHTLCPP